MKTTVQQWGNSLAVRIPKAVTRSKALAPGTAVVVREHRDGILVVPVHCTRRGEKVDWRDYIIPTGKRRKENVSEKVDAILYGAPR